jgi:hypothetical protein
MITQWRNWWKLWPRYSWHSDMSTNYGYNDYESTLNEFSFGPFLYTWYSL